MVVTDVHMPTMDGFMLGARLRERVAQLPIVFITGAADARTFDPATPSRMLRKPFHPDALATTIRELIDP